MSSTSDFASSRPTRRNDDSTDSIDAGGSEREDVDVDTAGDSFTSGAAAEQNRSTSSILFRNQIRSVSGSAVAGNYIYGSVYIGANSASLRIIDLTTTAQSVHRVYVRPPHYLDAVEEISTQRIVALHGPPNTGRRCMAYAALTEMGANPILRLPSEISFDDLYEWTVHGDALKQFGGAKDVRVGLILEEPAALQTFREWSGTQALREALADNDTYLVITTRNPSDLGFLNLAVVPPSPKRLFKHLRSLLLTDEQVHTFRSVIYGISTPSYATARSIASAIVGGESDVRELALRYTHLGLKQTLSEWLAEKPRTTREICALTLCVGTKRMTRRSLSELSRFLEESLVTVDPSVAHRYVTERVVDNIPFVEASTEPAANIYGSERTEWVQLRPDYNPDLLLAALWDSLGDDFQIGLTNWLKSCGNASDPSVLTVAASLSGALFMIQGAEFLEELSEAWLNAENVSGMVLLAGALGVSASRDGGRASARRIIRDLASDRSRRRRIAAALAYGGLYGLVDTDGAAPWHLWRLGDDKALTHLCNTGLVTLVGGFLEASQQRVAVLGMLDEKVRVSFDHRVRAFAALAEITKDLLSQDPMRILDGIYSSEDETVRILNRLWVYVFTSPAGRSAGQKIVSELVIQVSAGRLSESLAIRLLHGIHEACPSRMEAEFTSRLMLHLQTATHGSRDPRNAAKILIGHLFR